MLKRIIILFTVVFNLSNASAQTLIYSDYKTGVDLTETAGVLEHMDPGYLDMQLNPNWSYEMDNVGVSNILELRLNREYLLGLGDFDCRIEGVVTYQDEQFASHTVPFDLFVEYKSIGGQVHTDAAAMVYQDGHAVSVEITDITITPGFSLDAVELHSFIEVDRYYTFDATQYPSSLSGVIESNTSTNDIVFNWDYQHGAVEYELEWVFINNYDEGLNVLPTSSLFYNFKNNSTRISTKKTTYRISNVFEKGYIIYRIRGVGRKGSDYSHRLEGEWSSPSRGSVAQISNPLQIVVAHDDAMNWGYQASYTEGGKRFEGVSYSDGLGFTRQQQGRNNTENLAIVQETYYDHQGRPAVSALPAPAENGKLTYRPDFNVNTNGNHYSREDFDLDNGASCHTTTGAMGTTSGSGEYYSTVNPDQSSQQSLIPDASGYPLMRVEYMPDNTGRIRTSGMAGPEFQISDQQNNATTYDYGVPTQEQLDILFGTDAGLSQRYQRNIVTDANGQKSVSYVDPYGRVVATGLIGDNPSGLLVLPSNTGAAVVTNVWLDNNSIQDEDADNYTLEFTKTFVVGVDGFYDFEYTITPEEFLDAACLPANICYDCEYELEIELVDINCGTVVINYSDDVWGLPLDDACNNPTNPFTVDQISDATFHAELTAGTYALRKTLKVSQNSIDYYLQNYLEENTCLLTYNDFYNQILLGVDLSGCDADYCDLTCVGSIGTYSEYETANPGTTQAAYDLLIANCVESCNATLDDPCNQQEAQLLSDFYPGSQYASYTVTGNVVTVTDPLSIFYDDNTWQNALLQYLDANGNPSVISLIPDGSGNYIPPVDNVNDVTVNSGTYTTPPNNLANVADFINAYQLSWADEFLSSHPEYCYYQYCTNNSSSHDYDQAMRAVTTMSDAITLGYINPLDLLNPSGYPANVSASTSTPDLYFINNTGLPAYIKSQMEGAMEVFAVIDGVDRSIWEVAYLNTYCPEAVLNADVETCLLAGFDNFGSGTCYDDLLWSIYRDLYLNLKEYYYNKARTVYAIDNGCYNGCIGQLQGDFIANKDLDNFTVFEFGCTTCSNEYNNTTSQLCNSVMVGLGLYENKIPHFYNEHLNPYPGLTSSQIAAQIQSDIATQTVSGCASICELKVEVWMENLVGCVVDPATWVPGNTLYNNIYNGFLSVCTDGCDATHPGGSTTVGPSPQGTFTSVDDVLSTYLGTSYETFSCSPLLIPDNSYENSEIGISESTLDECACTNITNTINEFNGGNLPAGVTTLEELFIHHFGILPGDITSLVCECTASSTGNIAVGVPAQYSCDNCLPCETVQRAYNDFLTANSGVQNDPNFEDLMTNALNNELGYNLDADAYLDFSQECADFDPLNTNSCTVSDFGIELMAFLNYILNNPSILSQATTPNQGYVLTQDSFVLQSQELLDFFTANNIDRILMEGDATTQIDISFLTNDDYFCHIRLNFDPADVNSGWTWNNFTLIDNIQIAVPDPCEEEVFDFTIDFHVGESTATGNNYSNNDCMPMAQCVCGAPTLCDFEIDYTPEEDDCVGAILTQVALDAQSAYDSYIEDVSADFVTAYVQHCLGAIDDETLTVTYKENEYHHTLFYYDQAGNMFKSIPPKGIDYTVNLVDVATNRDNWSLSTVPAHSLASNYRYNTLNQLIEHETPDGGISNFWYDAYGRIAVSQNAKQLADNYYSYTKYDELGRLIEGGQVVTTTAITEMIVKDPVALENWINVGTRHEVTRSYYDFTLDASIAVQFNQGQKYLRNRISSVAYYDQNYTGSDLTYDHATHYSYDVHGNVIEVIQDNKELAYLGQDTKHTEYEFELVSGNVNKVKYQDGQNDAYYHEYCYDADNRLDKASSSENDVLYDQEAHYQYYKHGPLARTELGDWAVQGTDYAYTINGWLKGINGNVLDPSSDMGKDGSTVGYQNGYSNIHRDFGRDAFGFTLSYFDGDYAAINTAQNGFHSSVNNVTTTGYTQNLGNAMYNGNIRSMANALMDEDEENIAVIANFYTYDQLHRIKQMDAYLGVDYTNSSNTGAYKTTYDYDANGNLQFLTRKDDIGNAMDDFVYNYDNPLANNKLSSVEDAAYNLFGSNFGDVQPGQLANNYSYTAIGELESDVQEGIERIDWRYGDSKISKIVRTTGTGLNEIEYKYDAFGRRVLKLTKPISGGVVGPINLWKYTYYTYDASGNVMGVYELTKDAADEEYLYTEKEAHIYGASRLGVHNVDKLLVVYDNVNQTATEQQPQPLERVLGEKFYELSNHLGNVVTVITDRKLTELDLTTGALYTADVLSYSDYYPFGMAMPGRKFEGDYRYGFNGMEMDNEVKGSNGSHYTTPFRQYDPRIGRWMSLDPMMGKYPDMSPYVAFNNNPIYFADPLGLEGEGGGDTQTWEEGQSCENENGEILTYKGNDEWEKADVFEKSSFYFDQASTSVVNRYENMSYRSTIKMTGKYEGIGEWFSNPEFKGNDIDWTKNEMVPDGEGSYYYRIILDYQTQESAHSRRSHQVTIEGEFMEDLLIVAEQISQTHLDNSAGNSFTRQLEQIGLAVLDVGVGYVGGYVLKVAFKGGGYIVSRVFTNAAPKFTKNVLKPLGLGSTGRTTAVNKYETIAMEKILSNPNLGTPIKKLSPMTDKSGRWDGWSKMYYNYVGPGGKNFQIHFNALFDDAGKMIKVDDFKFVD
jgi:RHS repeat-associated protein